MKKTIITKQLSLQGRDYYKGLLIGAGTAVVAGVIDFLQAYLAGGNSIFELDWKQALHFAISGFIAYLAKNFLEPGKVVEVTPLKKKDENIPPVGDPTHPRG